MKIKKTNAEKSNLTASEDGKVLMLSKELATNRFDFNERIAEKLLFELLLIIDMSNVKPDTIINTLKFLNVAVIRQFLLAKPDSEIREILKDYDSKVNSKFIGNYDERFEEPTNKSKSSSSKKNNAGYSTAVTNPSKESK